MVSRVVAIPYRIEDLATVRVDGLCPVCLLPSLVEVTVALIVGHPTTALYDLRLVTVRGCTTRDCEEVVSG